MLQKWKHIIYNWINCYFDEGEKCNVNIKSLLNLISHLRDNLNLDESKSSVLEANTVEDFILEKYPSFKFENGTVVAGSEDDVYMLASLLLFFVCVNSKDVNIKSAMCSKLSGGDQEVILKFSKNLMECSPITCKDVQAAITEACAQEMANIDAGRVAIAETPPALRSLHGEVRRLQAALDAERFDRNYLQEELSRTNLRVEKLVKDKEKYKLEIMNLTAKISMSGGDELDAHSAEAGTEESAKMARQLNDMEERLVTTQEQLDNATYERDDLKKKLEDLKEDRDKWVSMVQEESARAGQLAEELVTERRHLHSLKELIAELRQHNRLNGLDSSQLECDDPDASIQSLVHNLSICSEACANVVEVQLCEERAKVDALKQQIETLQKENEQLHFAIEEDNSTREVIIKEKDCIIDKLEKQLKNQALLLESLRKEHEDVTLSWEKYKIETRSVLEDKDEQIRQLNEYVASLHQQYADLESVKDELNKKVEILIQDMMVSERKHKNEKQKLLKSLSQEESKSSTYAQDKEILHKQLIEERNAKDRLEDEQNHLHENYKLVVSEKKELLNEKMILAQQLAEEKSLRETLEEQKNTLTTQNTTMEQTCSKQVRNIKKKLLKEVSKTKALLQDKESNKQQLSDALSANQLVENEKHTLLAEKNLLEENITELNYIKDELNKKVSELIEKTNDLEIQYTNEKALNEVLNKEKQVLLEDLNEENSFKNELIKQNDGLITENEYLKQDLLTHNTVQGHLLNDKETLMLEKEELVKAVEMEKCAQDELQNEKQVLFFKLNELNNEYNAEVKIRQAELDTMTEQVKVLQLKCEDLEELNNQISNTVIMGLDKLILDLKNEVIRNEVLQRVISEETANMSMVDRCNLLITIADTLITEVAVRDSLERAVELKDMAQAELKEELKYKDAQINKLVMEAKSLQHSIDETRVELTKKEELHARELEKKIKEMHMIEKENEALTNDLNTVKIQLDVKVHSLKEKLVENENLTDKLKKSYECQIDNLNMMATKLTNYLKDKTNELEVMRKEKEKLQQAIENKNTAIKSLEDEVKMEKQNQERLINDFESERQILKNMVAVTESVMEDQRVTLNNVITEHVKANEMLEEDNRNIKEQIENERNDYTQKMLNKEKALELVQKDLAELKATKENVECELKSQMEALDLEITSLKTDVQNREDEVKKLKDEHNNLESILQDYKDNLITCESRNSELKINMDSIEIELRNKVDKLTESLQEQTEYKKSLSKELSARTEYITKMETKLKQLEVKINNLEQEIANLIDEKECLRVDNVAKINEIQNKFNTNSFKDAEDISKLNIHNADLTEENSKLKNISVKLEEELLKLKTVITNMSIELDKLKKDNMELEDKLGTLKKYNEGLEDQINKLKQDNSALDEELNKTKRMNMQFVEENAKLKKDSVDLEGEIDKFKKLNLELEVELSQSKKTNTETEEEVNKLKKYNTELAEEKNKLKGYSTEIETELETLKKDNAELEVKLDALKTQHKDTVEEVDKFKKYITQLEMELSKLKQYNTDILEVLATLKNDNNALEQELGKIKKDNRQLEGDLGLLKKENMDVTEQIKNVIDHFEEELSKFKLYNTEILGELDSLKKENTQLESGLGKLNKDNKTLQENLDALKNCNNDLQLELEKLKKQNTELEEGLAHTKNNNKELVEDLNKCKKDGIDAAKELDKLKKHNMELEEELAQLKTKNMAVEKELSELKTSNTELDQKYYQSKNNKTELEAELSKFKEDNTVLAEEVSKLKKDKMGLQGALELSQKTNMKFEEDLNKFKKNEATIAEELCKLKKSDAELEVELGNLKKDLTAVADQRDNMKERNMKLEGELGHFKVHNTELEAKVNKLKKDNVDVTDEVDKLKKYKLESELELDKLKKSMLTLTEEIDILQKCNKDLTGEISALKKDNIAVAEDRDKMKAQTIKLECELGQSKTNNTELETEVNKLKKDNLTVVEESDKLKKIKMELEVELDKLKIDITKLTEEVGVLQKCNKDLTEEVSALKKHKNDLSQTIMKLEKQNVDLTYEIKKKTNDITVLEQTIKDEKEHQKNIREDTATEKITLVNKCDILQDYHTKAEKELDERQKEIVSLQREVQTLHAKVDLCKEDSKAKDGLISKMSKEKDAMISSVNNALKEEKEMKEKYLKESEEKTATICELKMRLMVLNNEREALNILKNENAELIKAVGYRDTLTARSQDIATSQKYSGQVAEREVRDLHHQVDNTSDLTHSSMESLKTITDLEKIVLDKQRTITTLQSDVTFLKTLMAESENKLLDVTKELEVSKENCQQLSGQLKKIVHQKNEEIAELKKYITKMSATENRATQIIKVSAKYQAIILKRIAEIKSNTVLKELTNFSNSNNQSDNELRRSLTAGSITMEDLENFLETTERHLKKCTEKQLILQKERDRLTEVNRINESEIINLKKFLTELSVGFQTFSSVKDLYAQKLSRVISVQRTVRREILSLDGQVSDSCMLALERGYAAVMQDLAECAMNLERWVERCIGRTISSEKIKQAFMNDSERASLAPTSVQNAGLEVQLDELDNSFQKLLEEVSRAARGPPAPPGPARDEPAHTVMEVRAEYEDKLNRMKAKMKQLYTEQIAVFKEKQKEEVAILERELARARDKLAQSSRAYEQHIRSLTSELWDVGEKFLMKKDEAEWLRRKQRSGSLLSLQHVHSSSLVPSSDQSGRPSEAFSLRSLPVNNNGNKREGRGLHMSDEEGEVFDNRCLKELSTPRRETLAPEGGMRLSELRWRNSLCPPHLKSSYPAETQFAKALDEEEIKAMGAVGPVGVRQQRKEVGITAYKKPGPPTPSKQAGRLSATDSELRESLRVEADPQPSRKTSTPSRLRSLFRSSKSETIDGTPRSRRLSNIFKKK